MDLSLTVCCTFVVYVSSALMSEGRAPHLNIFLWYAHAGLKHCVQIALTTCCEASVQCMHAFEVRRLTQLGGYAISVLGSVIFETGHGRGNIRKAK